MKKSLILYFRLINEEAQVEASLNQSYFDELEWDGYYLDAYKCHKTGEKEFYFGQFNENKELEEIPLDKNGKNLIERKLDLAWNEHRLQVLREERAKKEADEEAKYKTEVGEYAYHGVSPLDFFNPNLY